MESYDALKSAMSELGVKAVAAKIGVSTSLVYKWCQEPSEEVLDGHSGTRNPLDRTHGICVATGERGPIEWLCERLGGVFVQNPGRVKVADIDSTVIGNTQEMLKEFSDVLDEVSRAIADDEGIDLKEAARIRREWEQLKSKTERFVMACETGRFKK